MILQKGEEEESGGGMEKKGLQRISPFLEKKNILNVVDFTFNCFVNSLSTGPKIVSLHSNNDRVFKTA